MAPSAATDPTDTSSVNLGVQFQASQNGTITGIRFYKEPDNTGTHTGTLWTASGTELATGTFTNESTQGWAGAGLLHPGVGHRGDDLRRLLPHDQPATTRLPRRGCLGGDERAADGAGNGGVYAYGSSTTFPTNTLQRARTSGSTWSTSQH